MLTLPARRCAMVGVVIACVTPLYAQDDDDDLQPGLLRTDTFHAQSWQTVVPDVWAANLPAQTDHFGQPLRRAQTTWRGSLLIKSEGKYRFHAFLLGKLRVTLDGMVVLDAETKDAAWVSGPEFTPGFGELPFVVELQDDSRPAAAPSSTLKLYWSSDSFPLEPVPHHVLYHGDDSRRIRRQQEGTRQLAAFSCLACHVGPDALTEPGPSLKHVGSGTSWDALRDRLMRRDAEPGHGRMPNFGLSQSDAEAVLAYLARQAQPVSLTDPPKVKVNEKETPGGRELIKSVGCLACHEWQSLGQRPVFGGGRLDDVATRRSRAWLHQWLRDPAVLNPAHRMPVFKLTDAERQQIVAALAEGQSLSSRFTPAASDDLVERGRIVIASARCAACHELPGPQTPVARVVVQAPAAGSPPIAAEQVQARSGCLASLPDAAKFRPSYPQADADAIAARLQSPEPLAPPSLLDRKNCLACHDRDGSRGVSAISLAVLKTEPQWQGQTPTLSPPPLTAVGDKIQDAALAKAIRGEQSPRMPWLKVRMPRFKHSDADAATILRELIDHDRIPDGAPATPTYPIHAGDDLVDPQVLLAGRELTGGKGFSCVACHALKDYVPKQVALGTRGSDLYRLGDRLRPEFFFRWTRSPLRIVPGVEMPSYQRPHPTLLDGQLDRQLAAIWDALHDPNFTAPTNPAVVEQFWTLEPGDRPRIIRDVFTLPRLSSAPPAKGGPGGVLPSSSSGQALTPPNTPLAGGAPGETESVPRAFAVGFPNGHSVLFDLDRVAVRAWTIGDFARQRTQGKSWFWDLAGVTIASSPPVNNFVAVSEVDAKRTWQFDSARLQTYAQDADRVRLTYEVTYRTESERSEPEGRRRTALVQETWRAIALGDSNGSSGWERSIEIVPQPGFPNLVFRPPLFSQTFGEPRLLAAPPDRPEALTEIPAAGVALGAVSGVPNTRFGLRVCYVTAVQSPAGTLPAALPVPVIAEDVTSAPGFRGVRLPLPRPIMPTAIAWTVKGRLAFTSLKGHVYFADDSDGDGLEDRLSLFAEGLAAPFGLAPENSGFLVAHKPEVLFLKDTNGDDRADFTRVIATGWGYTDDYHDWTTGIARDRQGWHYVGLGSDYAHKNRPANESLWRGRILRFRVTGELEDFASELRYPVGLAVTDDDRLFCSDQQGVQNCFNELNYIQHGHRYGVPAKNDPKTEAPADVAAVQIPHPWTRSVNGIAVWPKWTGHPYAGQIVGAEFNHRALVRFSLQEVDGQMQGAVYPLSKFTESTGPETFLGPISVAFNARGELYVGSLYDSGWLGGLNVGDIVKLTPNVDALPNGIREVRAIPNGFAIEFLRPIERSRAESPAAYRISGYTRVWGGEYATPDSGRHAAEIRAAKLNADGRTVELQVSGLKPGHVYDISVGDLDTALWPNLAHYTLTKTP